jgi:DNA helicase-2/ATP-dependent DNA helicase PcrA
MIGMEEKLFPHVRSLEDGEQMEEERRLCYVGMTRARERLYLTNARRRRIFGQDQFNQPSRFIADIPRDQLDLEDEGHGPRYEARGPGSEAGHNLAALSALARGGVDEVEIVPDEGDDGVWLGMKVRHGKFGVGTIRKVEGYGDDQKVIVWFNTVGPKKLLVRFAGLERV